MPAATVSDKTFGPEVLGAAVPVLVEFYSAQSLANEVLDELSAALEGQVKIVRVDVDRSPALRDDYGVRGLPALMLFKYGKPVARRVGAQLSRPELEEWIDGGLILALATRRISTARPASEFTLSNGLRVVVVPDHRMPVVTHMILYKAGSADEPKGASGVSHLVEHLSFKSLDKITDGDFALAMARIGGETNAAGYRDAAMYWHRVPRAHLETAMALEADRMAVLRVSDEEVARERDVLLERRRSWIENEPRARLHEKMLAALYRGHRYGQPSIGLTNDIAQLSRGSVERFHRLHYAPNNAVLVLVGDVVPDEARTLVEAIYGAIPASEAATARTRAKEPLQIAARRVVLEDPRSETALLRRSYAVPGYGSGTRGEVEAIEVLNKILAHGTGSRLYRKLVVEDQVATGIASRYTTDVVEAGELTLTATLANGDIDAAETAIDTVLEDIRRNGITQAELSCAKRSLVANFIYRGDDQLNLATRYAWAVVLGRTVKDVEERPAAISRVTAAEVKKAATTYLIERRSVTGLLARRRDGKNIGLVGSTAEHRPH